MKQSIQKFADIGFRMHLRCWEPDQASPNSRQFLLVHGLASNAKTWDQVGQSLAEVGHTAVAIDQRGHGLSQQVDDGYDFATITADLTTLLDQLKWDQPILIGQSWGGNVMTSFGVNYPKRAAGLVMVDGGFLDFGSSEAAWEEVEKRLTPPNLSKTSMEMIRSILGSSHPDWTEEGIDGTLANLWINEDGVLDRRLKLTNHMTIVEHLYHQMPMNLYPKIERPVLICAAGNEDQPEGERKAWIENAVQHIPNATYKWFAETDHDIHVHRPRELVDTILNWTETF
ncbi:MAG: alpha/beta hydrolase [Chloroflexota bacterium]